MPPPDRPHRTKRPLTINVPDEIREGIQRIADSEFVSLSVVIRRACLVEIKRRRIAGSAPSARWAMPDRKDALTPLQRAVAAVASALLRRIRRVSDSIDACPGQIPRGRRRAAASPVLKSITKHLRKWSRVMTQTLLFTEMERPTVLPPPLKWAGGSGGKCRMLSRSGRRIAIVVWLNHAAAGSAWRSVSCRIVRC